MSTDIIVVDCSSRVNAGEVSHCSGNIIRYVIRKVKAGIYAVTEIIVHDGIAPRMLSVSFKVGVRLYLYINSENRSHRMNDIHFCFTVLSYKQSAVNYAAIDAGEWIGDTIEREEQEKQALQRAKAL